MSRRRAEPLRTDILGVGVSAINVDDAVEVIESWIGNRKRHYICVTGAHGILESRKDERLCRIHNEAGLVTPDGMPLVWFSRLSGQTRTGRVYGPDLMRRVTSISAERGYRQYYYGGDEGVAERLAQLLATANPGLKVVGTHCPPFRALTCEEDESVIAAINAAKPDIVWVGLSTPKQERWMAEHRSRLEVPVLIGVGAAFDFLSGRKRQAPPMMQRHGLEWLFRLCTEPRRLWRRYAYIVPAFAVLSSAALIRTRLRSARSTGQMTAAN
jgi:N-acetylglucosaminyldiphosphoundecaprenol N-acetyl-beta-D-mannosaminyltransferase